MKNFTIGFSIQRMGRRIIISYYYRYFKINTPCYIISAWVWLLYDCQLKCLPGLPGVIQFVLYTHNKLILLQFIRTVDSGWSHGITRFFHSRQNKLRRTTPQHHSTTVLYLSFVNQRRRPPLWALDPTDMKNPDKVLPQVL